MWLVDTVSLKLIDSMRIKDVRYVILSHRWEGEEITFQDLQSPLLEPRCGWKKSILSEEKKRSMRKLRNCCKRAKEDGYSYAWMDTCCIDKSSSAELSEAINSMFSWYKRASVCYVYLSDVEGYKWDRKTETSEIVSQLRHAQWFTRGWTLQELIAPKTLIFFSRDWVQLGVIQRRLFPQHKIEPGDQLPRFEKAVCSIANIPYSALGEDDLRIFTVAEKMSWAASRDTTRVEDSAYSLMGIFDINMPLMYGEGHKAFQRLQWQIIETTEDYTIFAWEFRRELQEPRLQSGSFLAVGPKNFIELDKGANWTYADLTRVPTYRRDWHKSELKTVGHIPPSVTSRGIWMPLPIVKFGHVEVALLCEIYGTDDPFWLGIEVLVWRDHSDSFWHAQRVSRAARTLIAIGMKHSIAEVRLIYASIRDEYY